jgi:hypothetical protein
MVQPQKLIAAIVLLGCLPATSCAVAQEISHRDDITRAIQLAQ